jgi:hypothetical protein
VSHSHPPTVPIGARLGHLKPSPSLQPPSHHAPIPQNALKS